MVIYLQPNRKQRMRREDLQKKKKKEDRESLPEEEYEAFRLSCESPVWGVWTEVEAAF